MSDRDREERKRKRHGFDAEPPSQQEVIIAARSQSFDQQLEQAAREAQKMLLQQDSKIGTTAFDRKWEDWKKMKERDIEQEPIMIENWLWANCAFLTVPAVHAFRGLDHDAQVRVVKNCKSLENAWEPLAMMLSWSKDPKEWKKKKGEEEETKVVIADPQAALAAIPQFYFITIPPESRIVQKGLPASAPAMVFEKGKELFNAADYLLKYAVDDVKKDVIIEDDDNCTQFSEAAKAVVAAGGEENSIAVGFAPGYNKWAVGTGTGWKGREKAVKLSLAVAICFENPEVADRLCSSFPEFAVMWKLLTAGTALDPEAVEAARNNPLQVHVLQLAVEDSTKPDSLLMKGLPVAGVCIAYSKELKLMFSMSHTILQHLIDDVKEIEFLDDDGATQYPDIVKAIKRAGAEDDGFVVCICKAKNCWAVGKATGWKNRQVAGKLALSLVIAQAEGRIMELAEYYEEFAYLCQGTGLLTPEQAQCATHTRLMREGAMQAQGLA